MLTKGAILTRSVVSGSGVQWHDQIWLGRYDNVQSSGGYPSYLTGAAYGIHVTQTSDSCFFGLISRGGNYNDYNAVIAWADDAGDVLQFRFNNSTVATLTEGGAFSCSSNITAYSSDRRLKINIQNISDPIEKIKKINGVTFNWDKEECEQWKFYPDENDIGVIAQEVQEVIPEAIAFAPFDRDNDGNSKSGKDYLTVRYEKIIPLLVESIKEQQKMIEELKKTVEELKNK
jgi:hypothetical protein